MSTVYCLCCFACNIISFYPIKFVFNSGNSFNSFKNYIFNELKEFFRILLKLYTHAKQYHDSHRAWR
jgi:hypothetical protein